MTKKLIFLSIVVLLASCKVQQKPQTTSNNYVSIQRRDYIRDFKDLAIKEMKRSGIPASITLAQAMLESNNGNSTLARKANNHFGIKCHNGWSGGKIYHDDDRRGECFRKYNSVYDSYKDHSDFIVNGQRYGFLFELQPTDYKSWAKGLQKAGYATSNTYATLLIKIIEDNQLYIFDQGGSYEYIETASGEVDTPYVNLEDVDNFTFSLSSHVVHNRNRIDYIIAKKGDTFESITEEFGMLPWELKKYNELDNDAKLKEGDILYLQPKRNKAEHKHNYHEVKEGETMYSISQMYGIKLKSLYEKNLMEAGEEPMVGQKLWLRKIKPESRVIKENPVVTNFDE